MLLLSFVVNNLIHKRDVLLSTTKKGLISALINQSKTAGDCNSYVQG